MTLILKLSLMVMTTHLCYFNMSGILIDKLKKAESKINAIKSEMRVANITNSAHCKVVCIRKCRGCRFCRNCMTCKKT